MEELQLVYKDNKERLRSFILGIFIGLAVIVPGISGSTFAILLNLYDKLLYAIGNIFKKFKLCFLWLIPIILGALVGGGAGFLTIKQLINYAQFAITCVFAALMLGVFPRLLTEIKESQKTPLRITLGVIGLVVPIGVGIFTALVKSGNSPIENLEFYHYIIFILVGYFIAVTQVVPGLSATALLMALGYFKPLINSVSLSYIQANPMILLVYASLLIGFFIGLITFSKILTAIFKNHRQTAFYLIIGLAFSSIIAMFFNSDIYPIYLNWSQNPQTMILDICLGLGLFLLVFSLTYWLAIIKPNKKTQE